MGYQEYEWVKLLYFRRVNRMNRMEIEDQSQSDFDIDADVPVAQYKTNAPSVSKENRKDVSIVAQNISLIKQFNSHLKPYELTMSNRQLQFKPEFAAPDQQFKRSQSDAYEIIEWTSKVLIERGVNVQSLKDRDEEQVVVVRVVRCDDNEAIVEDNSGMETLVIDSGLLWIGMIVAIKVVWQMGKYHFKEIVPIQNPTYLPTPGNHKEVGSNQTKITIASGPFMDPTETEWLGLHLVRKVAQENNSNTIILMGPFVESSHPIIANNKCGDTFDEMINQALEYMTKNLPSAKIYVVPSTWDVTHLYPLPQPKLNLQPRHNVTYLGNPSYLTSPNLTIQLINHDFIHQITSNYAGRVKSNLMQAICDSYLKQPMILSCTGDAPVAENKLKSMYLGEKEHGKLIIYSSQKNMSNVAQVSDTLFVNVGSVMGNTNRVGNIMNITYFDNPKLQFCESAYVKINKLTY